MRAGARPRRHAPVRVHEGRVQLDARELAYRVRRDPRRRNVHLVVADDGVLEVRAPWRFALAEAHALVCEHAEWALRALAETEARRARRPALVSGAVLPLLDERLRLRVDVEAQIALFAERERRGAVRRRGSELRVLAPRPGEGVVHALLEGWYRREAARHLPARARELGAVLGLRPARVSIRAQRTRWGSCSERGTVSLNWRLLLVPSELADYIVVHELCHLRHLDHSRAFWAMVARMVPDHRARRARLDALQDSLAL